MDEQCKNCPYIEAIKDTQTAQDKRLTETEATVKDMAKDVNRIDKFSTVSAEQISMVFKILAEIKVSITEVNITIKTSSEKQEIRVAEAKHAAETRQKEADEVEKKFKESEDKKYDKLYDEINTIKASPGKRLERIMWIAVTAFIAAIAGGLATGKIQIKF